MTRAVEFDPALHSPARLKIMMLLAAAPVTTFNEIAKDANLTAGNLATHLKALEAAGYVEAARTLVDLKPRMRYAITSRGRDALRAYCRALEEAVVRLRGLAGFGLGDD